MERLGIVRSSEGPSQTGKIHREYFSILLEKTPCMRVHVVSQTSAQSSVVTTLVCRGHLPAVPRRGMYIVSYPTTPCWHNYKKSMHFSKAGSERPAAAKRCVNRRASSRTVVYFRLLRQCGSLSKAAGRLTGGSALYEPDGMFIPDPPAIEIYVDKSLSLLETLELVSVSLMDEVGRSSNKQRSVHDPLQYLIRSSTIST